MIFQFEHLGLWDAETNPELDIVELKKVLTRWQKGLEKEGWNALFIENHDKPRVVSTWGNDEEYLVRKRYKHGCDVLPHARYTIHLSRPGNRHDKRTV